MTGDHSADVASLSSYGGLAAHTATAPWIRRWVAAPRACDSEGGSPTQIRRANQPDWTRTSSASTSATDGSPRTGAGQLRLTAAQAQLRLANVSLAVQAAAEV